jgi:hypothetical protein
MSASVMVCGVISAMPPLVSQVAHHHPEEKKGTDTSDYVKNSARGQALNSQFLNQPLHFLQIFVIDLFVHRVIES